MLLRYLYLRILKDVHLLTEQWQQFPSRVCSTLHYPDFQFQASKFIQAEAFPGICISETDLNIFAHISEERKGYFCVPFIFH